MDRATEDSEEVVLASPDTNCSDVVVVDIAKIEVQTNPKIKESLKSPYGRW